MIEVLSELEHRYRYTIGILLKKIILAIVLTDFIESRIALIYVAHLHDLNANQIFTWRQQYQK